MVFAQGKCVDLSTRIYLDSHMLHPIMAGQLELGIEGCWSIWGFPCIQGAFRLTAGCHTVSWYDLNSILRVPVASGAAMLSAGLLGDMPWDGLWEGVHGTCYGLGYSSSVCRKSGWSGVCEVCLGFFGQYGQLSVQFVCQSVIFSIVCTVL